MSSKTLVTLLLDRSYSMHQIRSQTIEAINAWLEELRKSSEDMRFSLVQFDSHHGNSPTRGFSSALFGAPLPAGAFPVSRGIPAGQPISTPQPEGVNPHMQLEKTYEAVPISRVANFTAEQFMPRGGTPLIDAAITTIRAISDSIEGRSDIKVILAIQTDGEELNSFRPWSELKALVEAKEAEGWEIVFMGAGINAYEQGERMGVSRAKTISYGNDAAQTEMAFRSTAMKTVNFASGAAASMAYSAEEKLQAGDRYDRKF